jgi:protein FAM50
MNKTLGPGNQRLFDYAAEAFSSQDVDFDEGGSSVNPLSRGGVKMLPDISAIEGASDDAAFTKVVDRRWYERNKHVYPASVWQEFDPEKNYQEEIRRDPGGNAFFFTK